MIAQNIRFLVLPATRRWPNLASRVLKLVCERLAGDWQAQFGHPVLLVETFVDPNRFRGTCYKAAGWETPGQTPGFERCGQDFYLDTQHPKELWVRPLGAKAPPSLCPSQGLTVGISTPDSMPLVANQSQGGLRMERCYGRADAKGGP